ncbi:MULTISPECIES: tRNA(Met) cytidine acetate ligase [Aminobacterium]|jgi:predicted nucleotidyltransferase|uniref:tRNA(Met) cytidine acetate ligase n=1 Tax=Aminobacterium TaxID=81466 RepID=UPI002579C678|nr:nucleotidyltransferase family protein [Aminobacterium sp. UBA4987]
MSNNIVGIIAEYNPLHNGHVFQLEEAARRAEASGIVVVLSSHFTQRGEPSFIDKWQRTALALQAGADIVLELPVFFSCHNAGVFAAGAVDILAACHTVTHLSFGMENHCSDLSAILDILIHEPDPFKRQLRRYLDKGYSYVKARAMAMDEMIPLSGSILSRPNNSLALAYLLHSRKKGYSFQTLPIERKGADFHDEKSCGKWASASAIRKAYSDGRISDVHLALPPYSRLVLERTLEKGRIVFSAQNLWPFLQTSLLRSSQEEISRTAEMKEGLENLFLKLAATSSSWKEFISKGTSKRYTMGTLQRLAIHHLLGISHWENRAWQRLGPQYIRVLGFSQKGQKMLGDMRKRSTLPIITRGHMPTSQGIGSRLLQLEHFASILWEHLVPSPIFNQEIKAKPLQTESSFLDLN